MAVLELVEIINLNDGLLLPWFDLYETAFPAGERLLISTQMKLLKAKANGEVQDQHIYTALDRNGEFVGLIEYEFIRKVPAAFLWYLAVHPDQRGKGIGSQMYQQLVDQLILPEAKALVFEVEIPENARSEEYQHLAERRIAFYRRQGARLLKGIHYLQYIGWHHPPTPMHIMVHPRQPMDAQQAYQLAAEVFKDAIQAVGPLALR